MTSVVTEADVPAQLVEAILRPRDGLVREREAGPGRFEAAEGPVSVYVRRVTVADAAGGRCAVRQELEFRLALPFWSFLFVVPMKRRLGRLVEPAGTGWWLPPDRLDPQAARSLAALAVIAIPLGYLGTLLTQTITYAGREFHAGSRAQGVALAAARVDVVGAIVLVAWADRRGRRRALVLAVALGVVLTATGAAAPGLAWLTATQIVGRAFVTAATILVAIMAVEEMPAGARAYAISLLAMASALGAGICVMLLFAADLGTRSWRVLYAVPLLFLLGLRPVRRWLVESRRFVRSHPEATLRGHGERLRLLAAAGLLFYVFVIPASEYQNQFLRTEQHFSAARISLFTLLTATPGGLGIIIGGRLADVRGRRTVAAAALAGGSLATARPGAVPHLATRPFQRRAEPDQPARQRHRPARRRPARRPARRDRAAARAARRRPRRARPPGPGPLPRDGARRAGGAQPGGCRSRSPSGARMSCGLFWAGRLASRSPLDLQQPLGHFGIGHLGPDPGEGALGRLQPDANLLGGLADLDLGPGDSLLPEEGIFEQRLTVALGGGEQAPGLLADGLLLGPCLLDHPGRPLPELVGRSLGLLSQPACHRLGVVQHGGHLLADQVVEHVRRQRLAGLGQHVLERLCHLVQKGSHRSRVIAPQPDREVMATDVVGSQVHDRPSAVIRRAWCWTRVIRRSRSGCRPCSRRQAARPVARQAAATGPTVVTARARRPPTASAR